MDWSAKQPVLTEQRALFPTPPTMSRWTPWMPPLMQTLEARERAGQPGGLGPRQQRALRSLEETGHPEMPRGMDEEAEEGQVSPAIGSSRAQRNVWAEPAPLRPTKKQSPGPSVPIPTKASSGPRIPCSLACDRRPSCPHPHKGDHRRPRGPSPLLAMRPPASRTKEASAEAPLGVRTRATAGSTRCPCPISLRGIWAAASMPGAALGGQRRTDRAQRRA